MEAPKKPDHGSIDILLQDPLREVTRKERRNLLGVSAIAITMAHAGIVPERISVLGVEFSKVDQRSLLILISVVVLYFMLAFVFYGITDYLNWRLAWYQALADFQIWRRALTGRRIHQGRETVGAGIGEDDLDLEEVRQDLLKEIGAGRTYELGRHASRARAGFEFLLPLAVGGGAIASLIWRVIHIVGRS